MENGKRKIQKQKKIRRSLFVFHLREFLFFCALNFIFLFSASVFAQNLPDKVRGYKVYKAKISVKNRDDKNLKSVPIEVKDSPEAFVKVGEPQIAAACGKLSSVMVGAVGASATDRASLSAAGHCRAGSHSAFQALRHNK